MGKDTTASDFRQTFNCGHGRRTLANIMTEAKMFNYVDTPEEVAVQNFVKDILWKAECYPFFDKSKPNNKANELVDYLFQLKR